MTKCNFKIRENSAKTELIRLQNKNFKKRHIQYILCLAWFSVIGSLQWTSSRLSILSIVIQNSIILGDIEEKLGRILKNSAKFGKIRQNSGKFGNIRKYSDFLAQKFGFGNICFDIWNSDSENRIMDVKIRIRFSE